MRVLPPFVRRLVIRAGRDFCARRAVKRRLAWPLCDLPASLHIVLSHDTLLMGMLALRSLEHHTQRSWRAFIHDDGSLDKADENLFLKHFPDARMIRRDEADRALDKELEAFPACRTHRRNHNWFLKIFDTRHYAEFDRYIVMDSDLVFFRKPDFVLRWIAGREETCWFMEDTREKYASAREDIERALGFPLWRQVNSGLDLMVRAAADLRLAETFLERCAPSAREYQFLEQSLFAVFGSAWGRGGLLPREYEISWTNFRRRGAVCRHYVGPFKNDALYVEGATSFFLQTLGRS